MLLHESNAATFPTARLMRATRTELRRSFEGITTRARWSRKSDRVNSQPVKLKFVLTGSSAFLAALTGQLIRTVLQCRYNYVRYF